MEKCHSMKGIRDTKRGSEWGHDNLNNIDFRKTDIYVLFHGKRERNSLSIIAMICCSNIISGLQSK